MASSRTPASASIWRVTRLDFDLALSFDAQGEETPLPWIKGWHRVDDLKTGTFSVPRDFTENDAEAVRNAPAQAR